MKYHAKVSKQALKQLKKMDRYTSAMLFAWINNNLDGCENPYFQGKALKGKWKGHWRYRVGNYRIISRIEDDKLVILVLEVGHRREIYK